MVRPPLLRLRGRAAHRAGPARAPRIPPVYRLGEGPSLHGFIEGTPLDALAPAGTPVAAGHLGQIMEMFTHLSAVRPDGFSVPRLCRAEDRPVDGDSAGFLRSLIRFTRERAYRRHLPRYGRLFNQLGLPRGALGPRSPLAAAAAALTPRPFSLLHGDLHRANFIVDDAGGLWTIDWELAMLGDPLYDLATHLYLMNYPAGQQREVIRRWQALMSRALPGSTAGTEEDLPRYLAYKRAQSVYTDIVRHASALHSASSAQVRRERLRASAKDVHQVLTRGAGLSGCVRCPRPRKWKTRTGRSALYGRSAAEDSCPGPRPADREDDPDARTRRLREVRTARLRRPRMHPLPQQPPGRHRRAAAHHLRRERDAAARRGPAGRAGRGLRQPALVSDGTARRIEQALTQEEVTAAEGAYPTGYADGLIRTLHATGRGLAVTTNNSRESVERYLRARGLLKLFEGHVHGRFYDGAGLRIKPDPDCLLRALESTGVAAQDAVMIGDAARDLVAARAAGVEFVGYARNERKERELREAGAAHIVPSLREVLLAVDPCAHV